MKKLLCIAVLSIVLCACERQEIPQQETLPPDALAKVGDTIITQAYFDEKSADLDNDFKTYLKTPAGKENFLNFLIKEQLILTVAKDNRIDQSAEYRKEIEDLKKAQKQETKAKEEYLLNKLLMEKLEKDGVITVTDDETRAYYRKYPYEITILQILLSDPAQAADVMRSVANVKTQAKFEEAVKKFSADPVSKRRGGQSEPFIPGEYMPEIEIPAANTPVNTVQGFVKTPLGFHIIMKVKEDSLTYSKAKERIKQILVKQKLDEYLNSLKTRYAVEVKDESK
jgi:parvulin-like peptidyl-prolyl isomerase